MSAGERRQRILELLCLRRQDTYGNLASEFGVSRETIRHDIVLLMCSYPIETIRGRYDNTDLCSMATPLLTSIDYNYDVFAETLVKTVDGIYNSTPLPQLQLIAPSLIVRESSGPAKDIA